MAENIFIKDLLVNSFSNSKILRSVALHIRMGTGRINLKVVTVIIRNFIPVEQTTKLAHVAPKDDICGSVMLRKWNDQHIYRPLTRKRMDGTFKFWYLAG
jgi:hypothetical protein